MNHFPLKLSSCERRLERKIIIKKNEERRKKMKDRQTERKTERKRERKHVLKISVSKFRKKYPKYISNKNRFELSVYFLS